MGALISTIGSILGFDRDRRAVVAALNAVIDRGGVVDLAMVQSGGGDQDPSYLTATLHELRERTHELVLSQPTLRGRVHPVVTNQNLLIVIEHEGLKQMPCRVVGRIKLSGVGGSTFYGYRVSLPQAMSPHERRRNTRVQMPLPESCVEVELHGLDRDAPVRGVLVDISVGGMLIRSANADEHVELGKNMLLKFTLPDPVGAVSEHARVQRVQAAGGGSLTMIGVQFAKEIPGLKQLLSRGSLRLAAGGMHEGRDGGQPQGDGLRKAG